MSSETIYTNRLRSLETEAVVNLYARSSRELRVVLDDSIQPPTRRLSNSNKHLFQQFIKTLTIFNYKRWRKNKWFTRVLTIIRLPLIFCLTLFIPLVDYELELNGWTKLLNCIQILAMPALVAFCAGATDDLFYVPICVWVLIFSIPLAVLAFIFSRTDSPPFFHRYLAIYGIFGAVYVIYSCANELVQILQMLGFITHRSNSFLGCTLLAWGNSVGDLIANTAMARQGYERMAFAACLGGPLFNCLLTIGGIYLYKTAVAEDNKFPVGEGTLGENSTIIFLTGISVLILAALSTNFQMRRSIGALLMFFYIMFLTINCLSEFEIMHAYGSDHRLDKKPDPVIL